jgi:hypothetical protein
LIGTRAIVCTCSFADLRREACEGKTQESRKKKKSKTKRIYKNKCGPKTGAYCKIAKNETNHPNGPPKRKKGKQYQADKAWNQIKIELRQAVTTTRKKERQ